MIKQYQCKSCGLMFDADSGGAVVCPHCHSSNVEEVKQKPIIKTIIIAAAAALLVLVGVIFAVKSFKPSSDVPTDGGETPVQPTPAPADTNADTDTIQVVTDTIAQPVTPVDTTHMTTTPANTEEVKKSEITKITVPQVQELLDATLRSGEIPSFPLDKFEKSNPNVVGRVTYVDPGVNYEGTNNEFGLVSDVLDCRNMNPSLSIKAIVTKLDHNPNTNKVSCIYLNIEIRQ